MRRITVYTDEASAKKVTVFLEENGLDYMAEDYAEPTIQRRPPPERRTKPEVAPTEERSSSAALLGHQSEDYRPDGRSAYQDAILALLKTAPRTNRYLHTKLMEEFDTTAKNVGDVIRRMLKRGMIEQIAGSERQGPGLRTYDLPRDKT